MKAAKVLLISAEVSSLLCLTLLQFAETSCNSLDKGVLTVMFAVVAVAMQSMQQKLSGNDKK